MQRWVLLSEFEVSWIIEVVHVLAIVKTTYKKWPKDQAFFNHAVELLLGSQKLGTAYSLITTLPSTQAQVSTDVLEKVLSSAIEAKDRKRVS